MQKVNRRDISGVYIFHKFEDDEKREPTCFEDCPSSKQDEWLDTLEKESLKSLAKHLANKLRQIGDKFNITEDEY